MKNPSVNYLKIGQAAKVLGVSIDTLRRWEKSGKITTIRTPGGTRLYSLSALRKVNPASVENFQAKSLTTEELLRKTDEQTIDYGTWKIDVEDRSWTTDNQSSDLHPLLSIVNKFLIGSAVLSIITLLITSWITASYLTNPKGAQQFFKNNVASGILSPFHLLAEETVAVIDPKKAEELGFVPSPEESPPIPYTLNPKPSDNVLAVTASPQFLEANANTQINGNLDVRDCINGLNLQATPSAVPVTGCTSLTVTKSATIDQDVSTTSSPTFNTLNLSASSNQLVFQSGGPAGTLTWTPTATRTITLPDATTTLVGTDTTQTLTNKSLSGSSNTFTNIPNSALTNSKVTVTAGTNLSGGGDVSLGSSITISLKDSISLSGTLTVGGVVKLADGTAAAPSLAFTNDADTGLYRIGSNNIGLITGGSATSGITIDGSGNVGIGTISPAYQLQTTGNVGIGASLTTTGLGVFNGGLNVSGLSNLTGNVGVGSSLNVSSVIVGSNGLVISGTGAFTSTVSGADALNSNEFVTLSQLQGGTGSLWQDGGDYLNPNSSFATNVRIPAGNLGIGTSATSGSTFSVNGNGVIGWGTTAVAGPVNGLAVYGNVGIGTTSSDYNLKVMGTGYFSGFVGIGSSMNISGNVGVGGSLTVTSAPVFSSLGAGVVQSSSLGALSSGPVDLSSSTYVSGILPIANGGTNNSSFVSGGTIFYDGTRLNQSPANYFWDNNNSRLGIGTSAPSQSFQVNTNTSNPVVITSAGNVGIGNTSPTAILTYGANIGKSTQIELGTDAAGGFPVVFHAHNNNGFGVGLYAYTSRGTTAAPTATQANDGMLWLGARGYGSTGYSSVLNAAIVMYASQNWTDANQGTYITFRTTPNNSATPAEVVRIDSAGNVGIGTTSPSQRFQLNYSSLSPIVMTSGGNVGIGFTSPSNTLTVGATNQFQIDSAGNLRRVNDIPYSFPSSQAAAANYVLANDSAGNLTWQAVAGVGGVTGTGVSGGMAFWNGTSTVTADVTQLFWDDSNNRLGIGTSSPGGSLVVIGGNVGVGVTTPSELFSVGSGNTANFTVSSTGNVGIGASLTTTGLTLANGGLQVSGLSNLTGNVGIGGSLTVSDPLRILDYQSCTALETDASGNLVCGADAGSGITSGTGAAGAVTFWDTANTLSNSVANLYWDNTNYRLGIGTSSPGGSLVVQTGNVGIGISAPSALLQLSSTASQDLFRVDDNGVGDVTPFLIDLNGNVGIGKTTPTSLLDIFAGNSGQVTITSDLSSAARSTDVLTITQANDTTYNSTGNLLQLTNSDTGSTVALVSLSQVDGGTVIDIGSLANGATGINFPSISNAGTVGISMPSPGYGTAISITTAQVYSGNAISMGGSATETGANNFTGNLIVANPTRTLNAAATITDSGNFLELTRSNTVSNASGTFNITGDLATFSSTCTQTAGTCTDTSRILSLSQLYPSATGAVLAIDNAGSGASLAVMRGNVGIGTSVPGGALSIMGGNVGIGTTFPNATLSIQGNVGIGYTSVNIPSNGLAVLGNVGIGTTTTSSSLQIAGNAVVGFAPSVSAPTNGLLVSGNVGIGFTTPDRLLQIGSDIDITSSLSSLLGAGGSQLSITGSTANNLQKKLVFGIDTTDNYGIIQAGTSTTGYNLALNPAGGNVGIGTTNPAALLNVKGSGGVGILLERTDGTALMDLYSGLAPAAGNSLGSIRFRGNNSMNANKIYAEITATTADVTNGSEDGILQFYTTTAGAQSTATNEKMRIDQMGNVGIGTSTLNSKLSVVGNAIISQSYSSITVPTSGLFVEGNVGIGATTSNNKLDVWGGANITGNLGIGSSLTTTGLGVFNGGINVSGLTNLTGNVGIGGSASVASYLSVGSLYSAGAVCLGTDCRTTWPAAGSTYTASNGLTLSGSDFQLGGSLTQATGIDINSQSFGFLGGNVGVGTSNPAATLYVSGNAMIGYSSGAPSSLANGLAVSGNVGIGTTNPNAKLRVEGVEGTTSYIVQVLSGVTSGYGAFTQYTDSVTYNYAIGTVPTSGDFAFISGRYPDAAGTERMRITQGGNVGIGLTTANSQLSISNNAHIGSLFQGIAAPTNGLFVDGNIGIGATTSSNKLDVWGNTRLVGTLTVDSTSTFGGNLTLSNGQFLAPDGTSSLPSYSFTNSTSTGMYSPSANALALNTNGASTPPLTITAGGNVGIGTTAPTDTLSVSGNISATNVSATSSITALGSMTIGAGAGDRTLTFNAGSGTNMPYISFKRVGTEKFRVGVNNTFGTDGLFISVGTMPFVFGITSTGNVGIGATRPQATLVIQGNVGIGYTGANQAIPANGLAVLGNVGIGITTANQALEVNGRIRMDTWTADGDTAVFYNSANGDIGVQTSDVRLKTNISPIQNSLDIIKGINGVTFNWLSDELGAEKTIGVIAQDVLQVMPELTFQATGPDGQSYYGVHYEKLGAVLVEAVKDQQTQINDLIAQQASMSAVLANLSVDSDGTLNVPKLKAGSIILDSSIASASSQQLTADSQQLALNTDPNYTSPGPNLDSSNNNYIDLSGEIASLEERMTSQEERIAALEAAANTSKVSSGSFEVNTAGVATSSATASAQESTSSASVSNCTLYPETCTLNLTPPDILLATGSATLANLTVTSEATVSGMLTAYAAQIQDNFKSLGQTILGQTLIAGDLTVDGTLSLTGNSLSALGTLYIQNSALAQGVDILDGKVTIDTDGNITTQGNVVASEVKTNKLTISNTPIATTSGVSSGSPEVSTASIGSANIPAGQTKVPILTNQITPTSKVFITPKSSTQGQALFVELVEPGTGFVVSIDNPVGRDIDFDWWIVETN